MYEVAYGETKTACRIEERSAPCGKEGREVFFFQGKCSGLESRRARLKNCSSIAREFHVSHHNGGLIKGPLKLLRTIFQCCCRGLNGALNPFMPTVPTFAVRETDVSRTSNVGTVGKNWFRKRNGGQKLVIYVLNTYYLLGFKLKLI